MKLSHLFVLSAAAVVPFTLQVFGVVAPEPGSS